MVNPRTQTSFARQPDRAVTGSYPTLSDISRCYGKDFDVEWLLPQIGDLSMFTGAANLGPEQQEMLARAIAVEHSGLKVTEMLLFFHRFKAGRYGRFYGAVDPITVMGAIETFLKERDELRMKNAETEAAEWRQWAEERTRGCVADIRQALGLSTEQLYAGFVDGYQRKVRFSTDSPDVYDLITGDDNRRRIRDIACQHFDQDTRVCLWLNTEGGYGTTIE